MLRKAAQMAVCKINIDTDIRLAMTAAIRESIFKNPENFDPRGYLKPAREAVRQMVMHKIEAVVGSANTINIFILNYNCHWIHHVNPMAVLV